MYFILEGKVNIRTLKGTLEIEQDKSKIGSKFRELFKTKKYVYPDKEVVIQHAMNLFPR